jgi:hypothetical protein
VRTRTCAGLGIGRDGGDKHNVTLLDEVAGKRGDADDVFIAVGFGETEIAADGVAEFFGIENPDAVAECAEFRLGGAAESRLAGSAEAGEPEAETAEIIVHSSSCP